MLSLNCFKKVGGVFAKHCQRSFCEDVVQDKILLQKTTQKIFEGIISGERWALARAITLVESTNKVSNCHYIFD